MRLFQLAVPGMANATNTKLLNTLDKNIGIYQVNKKEIWVKNKDNKIEKRIVNINK